MKIILRILKATLKPLNKSYFQQLFRNRYLHILIIIISTIFVYSNIFQNDFAFDDPTFIIRWEDIRSWDIIYFFQGAIPDGHQGLYRPLRSVFYAISYHIWGNTNTFGYHLQSLLINFALIILCYLIINLIFHKKLLSFMSALLFSLHPVHIESITFMTASFDTIGVVFFFLSFYLYLKSKISGHLKNFYRVLSLLSATIAFYTYETTLTLIFLLILYDLCFDKVVFKKYLPYFCVALSYSFVRVIMLHVIARGDYLLGSFPITMLTMTRVIEKYFSLLLFPIHLNINHQIAPGIFSLIWSERDDNILASQSLFQPDIYLPTILIISLIILAIVNYSQKPLLTFCIGWFFISLSPVINIIPQGALLTERYLLIPSFGYCLLVASFLYYLYSFKPKFISKKYLPTISVFILLLIASFYFISTRNRNSEWRSSLTLWESAVREAPNSFTNNNNLVTAYVAEKKYDQAISQAKKIVSMLPGSDKAHITLGFAYSYTKQYDLAISEFKKSISLNPINPKAYMWLGEIYKRQAKNNNSETLELAAEALIKAIDTNPYPEAVDYFRLGAIYYLQNKEDLAINAYQKAIEMDEFYADAYNNLGLIYLDQGKINLAVGELKKASILNPQSSEIYFNLGKAYTAANQPEIAIQSYQKAIELNTSFAEAYNNLGILYTGVNNYDLAEKNFNKAIEINSNFAEAYFNLSMLYEKEDKRELATEQKKKGVSLSPNLLKN